MNGADVFYNACFAIFHVSLVSPTKLAQEMRLLTCVWDVHGSNIGLRSFVGLSLQENTAIVLKLGHDRFLPYPLQSIIH
jgi:hypothetical protein